MDASCSGQLHGHEMLDRKKPLAYQSNLMVLLRSFSCLWLNCITGRNCTAAGQFSFGLQH